MTSKSRKTKKKHREDEPVPEPPQPNRLRRWIILLVGALGISLGIAWIAAGYLSRDK